MSNVWQLHVGAHLNFSGYVVYGRPNFSAIQANLAAGRHNRFGYYNLRMLYLDGFDLRPCAQVERKRILKMLFDEMKLAPPTFHTEHFELDGEMFQRACE